MFVGKLVRTRRTRSRRPSRTLEIKEMRYYEDKATWTRKVVVAPAAGPGRGDGQSAGDAPGLRRERCLPPKKLTAEAKLTVSADPPCRSIRSTRAVPSDAKPPAVPNAAARTDGPPAAAADAATTPGGPRPPWTAMISGDARRASRTAAWSTSCCTAAFWGLHLAGHAVRLPDDPDHRQLLPEAVGEDPRQPARPGPRSTAARSSSSSASRPLTLLGTFRH